MIVFEDIQGASVKAEHNRRRRKTIKRSFSLPILCIARILSEEKEIKKTKVDTKSHLYSAVTAYLHDHQVTQLPFATIKMPSEKQVALITGASVSP